ncbi:hypothetical protein [Sagittula salina]|uniref:Uncharacterized protein n=1 Tax=Sagittula salina TaxID=2820268 RepID=A0A940MR14_9RHOB|nr:hypothetical protein [Sagittula salina]MBP0483143.1 hypothetical protein [Sagittula salina]
MKRLATAFALSLLAAPAMANVGPIFLPDLTFPAPVTQPDVATRGTTDCQTSQAAPCR